jgi:uncharacterized SAM-binding protein YcdF (DUF218 family)
MNVVAESMQSGESSVAELVMAVRPRPRRWLRRLVWLLIVGGVVYAFRHPIMTAAAKFWIVDEKVEKVDAAVVLGGGMDSRPFFAAEMYQHGVVPLVLVANVRISPTSQLNLMPPETEISTGVLRKMGVPDASIQRFGAGLTSTRDEAKALHSWLESHPLKHIVIATDAFHTRRVRYIFTYELKDLPVQISVCAVPSPRFDPLRWWESEEAAVAFQNEVFKLIYYVLRR